MASIYEKHTVRSVGNGMTFRRDLLGESDARKGLQALSEEVAERLRRAGLKCRTVQLTVKDPALRPRPLEPAVLDGKAHRADQVQLRPRHRAGAGNIAGILRDLRLYQHNMKHIRLLCPAGIPCRTIIMMNVLNNMTHLCSFQRLERHHGIL